MQKITDWKKDIFNSPFLNVFLFSFFWAIQLFVTKLAFLAGAKPVSFTFQTAIASFIFLTIYVLPRKYKELSQVPFGVIKGVFLANAIHFGFGSFFSTVGVALTSAINAGFLVKFALLTTILLAWIFLKEKLTIPKLLAVTMMFLGSFFLATKGQFIIPQIGDLLLIFACLSWSTGNILVRKFLKGSKLSGEMVSFLRVPGGLPILLIFILFSPLYPLSIRKIFMVSLFDLSYLDFVLVSGLFIALLSVFLNRTLKVATASYMTMMSMITPVIVTMLAILFLKETMVFVQIVGAILIISSGVVTYYFKMDKD